MVSIIKEEEYSPEEDIKTIKNDIKRIGERLDKISAVLTNMGWVNVALKKYVIELENELKKARSLQDDLK